MQLFCSRRHRESILGSGAIWAYATDQGAGDPSLRLKSGSVQDDANLVRTNCTTTRFCCEWDVRCSTRKRSCGFHDLWNQSASPGFDRRTQPSRFFKGGGKCIHAVKPLFAVPLPASATRPAQAHRALGIQGLRAQSLERTFPPTDMPWNVREMHLRHPDGNVFRVDRGFEPKK